MTTTMLRMIPLVVLLAACGKPDTDGNKDTDTNPDSDTTTDTGNGDSGGGDDGFVPTSFYYSGDFSIGADLLPRTTDMGGTPVEPYFQIEMQDDGGDSCTLFYFLHPEAYAYAGQSNDPDTTADADVLAWIDAHGAGFGFKVEEGAYEPAGTTDPADRCADLDLAAFNEFLGGSYADLHTAALQLGGTGTMFFGLNASPTAAMVKSWNDANTGVDDSKLLGGVLTLPFEIGTDGDTFDSAGLWTDIDDNGVPANDGTNYVFNDAVDAFNDAKGEPSTGFFRFLPAFGITFSAN